MTHINATLDAAVELISKGCTKEKAKKVLASNGYYSNDADLYTEQAYKARNLRKRKLGVVLGLMGITLLVTGFFLTAFLLHQNQSIDLTLYGLTSTGMGLLLLGIVKLLGW